MNAARFARRLLACLLAALAVPLASACAGDGDTAPGGPFAIAVVELQLGDRAGFGTTELVLGPPRGAGESAGSLDTLSLGVGGSIVVELGKAIVDGPGTDFVVFENAFIFGGNNLFTEPGEVAVSEDGVTFHVFPCNFEDSDRAGCAGIAPVFAHAEHNEIDPMDHGAAGGDAFDLADLPGIAGLSPLRVRFVRIIDAGTAGGFGTDNAGFDLDAVAVVNGERP